MLIDHYDLYIFIPSRVCVPHLYQAATPDFHTDSHWGKLPLEPWYPWWRFADENPAVLKYNMDQYRYLMRHE